MTRCGARRLPPCRVERCTRTCSGCATRSARRRSGSQESFAAARHELTAEQAQAYRALATLPTWPVTTTTAAHTLERSEPEADRILESLVDVHLLCSPAPGSYAFHDLLRLAALDHHRPA